MHITVKNLQQQTFSVEIDEENTVLQLKEKIFREKGDTYLAEKQKLIYAGVILDDDRTIKSYNIDTKKFVVVMLKRDLSSSNKTSNNSSSVTAQSKNKEQTEEGSNCTESVTNTSEHNVPVSSDSNLDAIEQEIEQNRPNVSSIDTENVSEYAQPPVTENILLMGDEYNRSVESITEMGYSREMVERAMAASYNNPERAVEYLINGIPSIGENLRTGLNLNLTQGEQERGSQAAGDNSSSQRINVNPRAATEDPFEFLRNQPQFLQMRSLIHHNPELLHAVLQQIGQTNPALLQLISDNQDAFLNMLNQPIEENIRTQARDDSEASTRPSEDTSGDQAAFDQPRPAILRDIQGSQTNVGGGRLQTDNQGVSTIQLSQTDQEAIERLKALGFPEPLVLQAYFACDKDEQLAANFLISSAFDD